MLVGFGSREVYESADGVEAFELVRTVMPSLIITDLVMPIFNGLQFIQMVKEPQSPAHRTPILVLSGYLTRTAALKVRNCGAEEVLVKPVSPKTLYEHILRIVLHNDTIGQSAAFLQNQRRLAELRRKKRGGIAYI